MIVIRYHVGRGWWMRYAAKFQRKHTQRHLSRLNETFTALQTFWVIVVNYTRILFNFRWNNKKNVTQTQKANTKQLTFSCVFERKVTQFSNENLWISGETSNMNGVGDMPPSMSQSLTGDMPNCMTQSMQATPSPGMADRPPDIMTTSTSSLSFKTGRKSIPNRSKKIFQIYLVNFYKLCSTHISFFAKALVS